jgi:hypothetical protein
VAHAEHAIDRGRACLRHQPGEFIELNVVRVHQSADFPEPEQLVVGWKTQNVEHRLRPEYPAARQVPVPKPAPAAIERGIDTAAHGVLDARGLAHQSRLPQECKAEHQDDESGRREQRDRERGVGAPFGKDCRAALRDRKLAERLLQIAQREQARRSVGEHQFGDVLLDTDCAGERIAPDCFVQLATDIAVQRRHRGDDRAARIGQEYEAPRRGRARHVDALEHAERPHDRVAGIAARYAVHPIRQDGDDHVEFVRRAGDGLAQPLANVDEGRDTERCEKCHNENRDRSAQKGFRSEKPPIGGPRDRLC